jgi:hypothetical protein
LLRRLHPNRLAFEMFSDENPFMRPFAALAEAVRAERQPVSADNPLLAMERSLSQGIVDTLTAWGKARDAMSEAIFLNTYGSPLLQAMVGLGDGRTSTRRRIDRDLVREAAARQVAADLEKRVDEGGTTEAAVRALIYVRLPDGKADERGYTAIEEIRTATPAAKRMGLTRFKEVVKEQFLILKLDEERAVAAIPKLLPEDQHERDTALAAVHRVLAARRTPSAEGGRRLARIDTLFGAAGRAGPHRGPPRPRTAS